MKRGFGVAAVAAAAAAVLRGATGDPTTGTLTVRPWGPNALRVQLCADACSDALPSALDPTPPGGSTRAWQEPANAG